MRRFILFGSLLWCGETGTVSIIKNDTINQNITILNIDIPSDNNTSVNNDIGLNLVSNIDIILNTDNISNPLINQSNTVWNSKIFNMHDTFGNINDRINDRMQSHMKIIWNVYDKIKNLFNFGIINSNQSNYIYNTDYKITIYSRKIYQKISNIINKIISKMPFKTHQLTYNISESSNNTEFQESNTTISIESKSIFQNNDTNINLTQIQLVENKTFENTSIYDKYMENILLDIVVSLLKENIIKVECTNIKVNNEISDAWNNMYENILGKEYELFNSTQQNSIKEIIFKVINISSTKRYEIDNMRYLIFNLIFTLLLGYFVSTLFYFISHQ